MKQVHLLFKDKVTREPCAAFASMGDAEVMRDSLADSLPDIFKGVELYQPHIVTLPVIGGGES